MKLLIVESPGKVKTINKYLGSDFRVIASVGHVRDLKAENGAVEVDNNFKPNWEISKDKEKQIKEIEKLLKSADELYIATDQDREGEAIGWHILDILSQKEPIKIPVKRVVFNEITKKAVLGAVANPREIDTNLVNAYLARRILDYLVGFNLSPVLWRKLPGSKAAGRVQSVALRLVAERESEIEDFVSEEFWSIEAKFKTVEGNQFDSKLWSYNGEKLEKFSIKNEESAKNIEEVLNDLTYHVANLEKKKTSRNPFAPFTTSTLQQEASRKLKFGAKKTMQVAQKLYESGLITYMRTDSVALSQDALTAIRNEIGKNYGAKYLPEKPVFYANKSKNAQEAHEAIRPSDITKSHRNLDGIDVDGIKLYELIWKRAIASQMEKALFDQVSVDIASDDKKHIFRSVGTTMVFDGYLKIYNEDKDEEASKDDEDSKLLPVMNVGEKSDLVELTSEQHWTQPPARYSEASLVKKLEELGIGRPSTYASVLARNVDHDYMNLDKMKFHATERGRLVAEFLKKYFPVYVQYDFTAGMEDKLDDISNGKIDYIKVLNEFWKPFINSVQASTGLSPEVIQKDLQDALQNHLFKPVDGVDVFKCPECKDGVLGLKLGKFGGFIGCSNYPNCKYTKQIIAPSAEPLNKESMQLNGDNGLLGLDQETGLNIYLKKGPYGSYLQLGENADFKKRFSLPKGLDESTLNIEKAKDFLALPKKLSEQIEVGVGKFGPYLKQNNAFTKLPAQYDPLTVTLEQAMEVLAGSTPREGAVNLGTEPRSKKDVLWYKTGKFGPYVKCGKVSASVPEGYKDTDLDLKTALFILNEKVKSKK
ncbi:MAG: type I DNA topoisomerase [Rickettsiales bacterium]|jgi:DNA topoisomerase-1|nr:type I DNA topoisomerase [Rickettsiales bacterium]